MNVLAAASPSPSRLFPIAFLVILFRDEDAEGHLALDDESVGLFFDLRSQVRHDNTQLMPPVHRVADVVYPDENITSQGWNLHTRDGAL